MKELLAEMESAPLGSVCFSSALYRACAIWQIERAQADVMEDDQGQSTKHVYLNKCRAEVRARRTCCLQACCMAWHVYAPQSDAVTRNLHVSAASCHVPSTWCVFVTALCCVDKCTHTIRTSMFVLDAALRVVILSASRAVQQLMPLINTLLPPLMHKITTSEHTSPYDIAICMYALASMDLGDPPLFDALLATNNGIADRTSHTDVAQIVWACGRTKYMGSRSILGNLVTRFVTSIAAFESRELTMLLWGMHQVRTCQHCTPRRANEHGRFACELSMLLWGMRQARTCQVCNLHCAIECIDHRLPVHPDARV